ncbi:MAG TPA: hypothetical protein GXX35_13420 [Thermoanaerobacterales bacterium]|nr:hypothetical protein [Thermoanaerobacterales bacterium]
MFNRNIVEGFKKLNLTWPVIILPFLWDTAKILAIYMSSFLGYNLNLDQDFGSVLINIKNYDIRVFIPSPLPSIQQLGLLNAFHAGSDVFNNTWAGITAYGAFLFLGGLVTAGYLGLLKDGIRNRKPHIKTFFQFAWYYGPRFFLVFLFEGIFLSLMTLFDQPLLLTAAIVFLGFIFILVPYTIVMEDYGLVEAAIVAPMLLLRHLRDFAMFFLKVAAASTVFCALIGFIGPWKWLAAIIAWPYIGTCLVLDIMLFYHDTIMKQPLTESPREYLRGYGPSLLKTVIIILVVTLVAGLPTVISKNRYFSVLMPWHHPVMEKEGCLYQTEGSMMLSPGNRFKKVKLMIDSLSPSKDDILYTKPGFIRGKGRIIANGFVPVYFSFELSRTAADENAVYSLQNGGKVEATDGIWGNPVERGMILAISGDMKCISGVIYDRRDYSEFNTIWSPEKDCVLLGPVTRKKNLYGFYASDKTPQTPVEFQWIYNRALTVTAAGEKDPLFIMEKLNAAFESLDLDLLLKMLYYVSDLKPENVLALLQEKFSHYKWDMKAKGIENWAGNVKSDVSYYPISNEKIMLVGDYHYLDNKLGFRAELFKIGERWKITKMTIKENGDK